MKRKHTFRSVLSMILALLLCASLPMAAFAEDGTVVSDPVANDDGTSSVVSTTTSTSTDAEGNTTITVTIEKDTSGTLNDGSNAQLVREESRSESITTNPEGVITKEHFVEDGKETKSYEEADTGDEAGQTELEVILKPGESSSGEAVSTETSGDLPQNEDDKSYDYTETTTTEREVTATTGEVTVKTESGEVELKPVSPDTWTTEKTDGNGETVTDENGNPVTVEKQGYYKDGTRKEEIAERENYFDRFGYDIVEVIDEETGELSYKLYSGSTEIGYAEKWKGDFQYCGYGDYADTIPVGYYVVSYQKDANGNILYDENNKPLTKSYTTYGDAIQFALQDKEGKLVYAYCVDLETGTRDGAFYDVANLEDNTYYADEESESHIRAIVTKGYWGSSEGTGSLANMKAGLKDAISNGTISDSDVEVPKYDENGKALVGEDGKALTETKKLSELVDELTEGEALAVTQAAIWSWSNGSKSVDNGSIGEKVVGLGGWGGSGNDVIMDALYLYLMGLTDDGKKESVVIDDNSFLEEDGLKLVIGDKAEGHENNLDDNSDNDVYDSALNFKLAFVPGEKDDLLVQISYTDLDGNNVSIIKRLAGENAEGQSYEDILPEADGSYLIKGLKLSENEDFNFDLKLEGTQYLEQGVYVYSPVGGRDVSQTFVGMAEGERDVDVSIGVTVSFEVDENNKVVAERVWHDEGDPSFELPETGPDEEPEPTPPTGGDGGEEGIIEEEPVPLAKAPDTGSLSVFYALAAAFSGMGLAGLSFGKKNKEE